MRREVFGRSDGDQAPAGSDADRDHVLLDALSQPYSGVKAVLDDVAERGVQAEFELDVGIGLQHRPQLGPDHARQRMVGQRDPDEPEGLSRNAISAAISASISSIRGASDPCNRSPASVSATLTVVRVRSRMPIRASSPLIVWLSVDCAMPSFAAALVKLRSPATAETTSTG